MYLILIIYINEKNNIFNKGFNDKIDELDSIY